MRLTLLSCYAYVQIVDEDLMFRTYNTKKYKITKFVTNGKERIRYSIFDELLRITKYETKNILIPIGSVVRLTNKVEMLIAGRALEQEDSFSRYYSDYIGYVFPMGQINEEKYIFNHAMISELIHVGYQTEDTDLLTLEIKKWIDETKVRKFDASIK